MPNSEKGNIARTLTINGNGNLLDFGHYSLMLENNNQKNDSAWNITFSNIKMKGVSKDGNKNTSTTEPGTFGLISLADVSGDNQKKITINFNDVTADVIGRPIISGAKANKTGEHYTLNLSGNNSFTNEGYDGGLTPADDGSALEAGIVNVTGGTTTINMTKTSGYKFQYGGNAIRTADNGTSVTVAEGATLSIHGGKDVRGIFTGNGIDSTVEVNGTLNENMGDGHSMGIFAGNLNVGQKGTVYIQTKQDNNGADGWGGTANFNSHHYAPISIGVGNASNVANAKTSTLNIAGGGTVRIIRSATNKTTESPLISFGSGASGDAPTDQGHFILNVNQGATLDLQDAAQYKASEDAKHRSGLISMWGQGSYITGDEVHITNPKLFNLQRTGAQTGNLIRLEAKNNHVYITGTTPVAQWDTSNTTSDPSFAWSVKDLTTQNAFGDYSIRGYVPAGDTEYTGNNPKTTLLDSNAILTMGANQAGKDSYKYENGTSLTGTPTDGGEKGVNYVSPYYNQILNHFNWWTSQRIAMGSDLLPTYSDAQKYAPEAKEIDTNTDHKLGDEGVTVKDGIKDILDQDGNVSSDGYSQIDWTKSHWYNSSDVDNYKKQFGNDATLPDNPEGNLKTTDTSAVATIVYTDKSVDFVTVPLKVTEPSIADKQTPDGGTITVPENHTLDPDDAKSAITNNKQLDHVSGYTWKTTPDTTIPGTKSGVVTVTYTDNSTDDVPVTVNVQSLADQFDPKGQDIHVTSPSSTAPGASEGISNTNDLPSGTKYTWSETPDVSKPDTKVPGVVKVTYSDGSEDQVPINVIVGNPSTSTTKTIIGTVPNADQGISNKDTLPSGTKYTWSQTPNVYSKGEHPAVVQVTYPDSSIDYVPTTVTVTNEPTGKNITTPKDTVPDAKTSIDWGKQGTEPINTPSGTNITWATEPDVSKPGDTTGTAKIVYPDGETTTVVVPIHVTDPDSTNTAFDPYGTTIRVPYGHELTDGDNGDAKRAIAGGVPSDATDVTYTWKNKPATSEPNVSNTTQQGYVTVKGTLDGKSVSKDVIVYVRVGDQAENYDPTATDLEVPYNANMNNYPAANQISGVPANVVSYDAWAPTPVTIVSGTQPTMIKVTYKDGSWDYVPLNVTVDPSDADKYQVKYAGLEVKRPNDNSIATNSEPPTITPEGMPTGTITGYTKGTFTNPDGITTIMVDNNGNVAVSANKNANFGSFTVPVNVSYADGSNTVVYVPVSITGDVIDPSGDHTYYGNQSQTIMKAVPTDVHKTSDDFTPDAAKSGFNEIIYNYDWDGTSGNGNYNSHTTYKLGADGNFHKVNADGTLSTNPNDMFASSKISYTWMNGYTPNTNFGDQTETVLAKKDGTFNPDEQTGAGDNLPGNSKYRVNVEIDDHGITAMLGLGFSTYKSWNNVYFNFYGAKSGIALTFKQNSDISNLSQDQYRQLIDVTDLGKNGWNGTNINPNAPQVLTYLPGTDASKTFAMTWAPEKQPSTKDIANGVRGTVRIHFNDGTYLDVPATINVVKDDDAGKPDSEKTEFSQKIVYQYKGKEVGYTTIDKIAKGSNLSADQLKTVIDANVPNNYQIVSDYRYPDAINNIVATPKDIIVRLALKDNAQFAAEGHIIYKTADGRQVGTGSDIKTNKGDTLTAGLLHDLADQNVPKGYQIVTYPGTITVSEDNFTIPVTVEKQANIPVPYDPTKDNMDMSVTRTINYDVSGTGHAAISSQTQTVEYTRKDKDGNAGYQDPVTGDITWNAWHVKDNGTAEFPQANVEQIKGYDSYVDGKESTKASAATVVVTGGTPQNGTDVTVTYKKQADIPVPYDSTKDNMDMSVTRKINYDVSGTGHEAISSVTQTVEYTRKDKDGNAGYQDPATGEITWNAWHVKNNGAAKFPEADVEQIKGYDSYVDGTKAIKVGATDVVVTGGTPQNGAAITVTYKKQSDIPVPYDPTKDNMDMSVTRTINYDVSGTGHAAIPSVTQTVEYTRKDKDGNAGYQDPVTGDITWNAWHVKDNGIAKFPQANVEQITGYDSYVDGTKATKVSEVNVVVKNDTPQNGAAITVTYKSNAETPTEDTKVTYQLHDDTDNVNVGSPVVVTGKPGTSQNTKLSVPEGYKLAQGQTLPDKVTMPAETGDTIIIHLVHATKAINPTDPGVDPTKDKYKDMFTSATRKIYQTKPGQSRQLIETQTVNFGRSGVEDLVTGKVTGAGDWKAGKIQNNKFVLDGNSNFGEYNVPQIDGYVSYVDNVKSKKVSVASALDKDGNPVNGEKVEITYKADQSKPTEDTKVTYQFYDDTDKKNVGSPVVVTGKPGVTENTGLVVPDKYKLAQGQTLPSTVTMPAKNGDTIIIHLVHDTKSINPTDPGVDPNNDKYKDMFTSATRKIYQTKPGQSEQLIETQTVNFGRNGVEDLVTGKVTGTGDWKPGKIQNNKFVSNSNSNFGEFSVPQISGYASYVDGFKNTTVASASALKNGQPTDAAEVHIAYLLAGAQTNPIKYDPKDDRMNKTVTRTITVYKTDGTTKTIIQKVDFVRGGVGQNAGIEDKNGNIVWTAWTVAKDDKTSTGSTEGNWAKYDVPTVKRYDSTVDGNPATVVNAQTVSADTKDATVTVAYTHTINPDDPSINPTNPGQNSDMFAHPTRTIHVVKPDGTTTNTIQTVWFGRSKTFSTDPKVKTVYGKWQVGKVEKDKFVVDETASKQWDEFTAPTISGYTADPSRVDAQPVTADTKDTEVTINYKKSGSSQPGDNGDHNVPGTNPGNNDNKPDNGPKDDNQNTPDDNNQNVPDDNSTDDSDSESKTKNHKHTTKKSSNRNSGSHSEAIGRNRSSSTNPSKGEDIGNQSAKSSAVKGESGPGAANTKANSQQQTLPETGNQNTSALGAIGLAIASLAGLFGLGSGKKRKDE